MNTDLASIVKNLNGIARFGSDGQWLIGLKSIYGSRKMFRAACSREWRSVGWEDCKPGEVRSAKVTERVVYYGRHADDEDMQTYLTSEPWNVFSGTYSEPYPVYVMTCPGWE